MSVYASFCVMDGFDGLSRPLRYRQSHVLPSPDDERAGWLDLALIPGHITRDGRDDGPEDGDACWPYLRVCVAENDDEGVTVVLDAHQVTYLRDQLEMWLARVHDADPGGNAP